MAPEQRYAWALGGILVLLLGLTSGLTLQAYTAARNHRQVAEQALGDFAGMAAWSFRSRTEALLFNAMVTLFRDVGGRLSGGAPGPSPEAATVTRAVQKVQACACVLVIPPRATFALDLVSRRLDLEGRLSPAERNDLVESLVADVAQRYAPQWDFAVKVLPGVAPRTLFYTVRRDSSGRPAQALGFEAEGTALRKEFFEVIAREYRALAAVTQIPNDSLASVVVRSPEGAVLYASTPAYRGRWRGTAVLGEVAGGLGIEVTLSPAMADRLLPGSRSTPSVASLVGLLVATLLLLASAGLFAFRAATLARVRARFTAAVSHELRTPLSEILLYAETMAVGRLGGPADYQREAGVVVDEARRLLAMIDNVLHVGQVDPPSLHTRLQPLDLGATVGAAVAALTGRATRQGVDLSLRIEPDMRVEADPDAVRAVVRNLVDNALKYGGDTPIVVSVARVDGWCQLAVEDRGPGIPVGDRPRVWRLFERLDTDATTVSGGSGIGLAVVSDLMRRHGGEVGIDDGPQGGVRVYARFPPAGMGRVRGRNGAREER